MLGSKIRVEFVIPVKEEKDHINFLKMKICTSLPSLQESPTKDIRTS